MQCDIEMETSMALNPGQYLLSIGAMDTKTLNDFKDPQQNLWVSWGSGSAPSL